MLSASDDVVHASGAGVEAGVHGSEEYWQWRGASRLATDGRVLTSGPEGTRVRMPHGYAGSTPRPSEWLGWTDRLLHPRHLYVWGRVSGGEQSAEPPAKHAPSRPDSGPPTQLSRPYDAQ